MVALCGNSKQADADEWERTTISAWVKVSGWASEVNLPELWPTLPFLTQMSSWTPQFRSPPGKTMQFQWATLWWREDDTNNMTTHTKIWIHKINRVETGTGCWQQLGGTCIWTYYVGGQSALMSPPTAATFINWCIRGSLAITQLLRVYFLILSCHRNENNKRSRAVAVAQGETVIPMNGFLTCSWANK